MCQDLTGNPNQPEREFSHQAQQEFRFLSGESGLSFLLSDRFHHCEFWDAAQTAAASVAMSTAYTGLGFPPGTREAGAGWSSGGN